MPRVFGVAWVKEEGELIKLPVGEFCGGRGGGGGGGRGGRGRRGGGGGGGRFGEEEEKEGDEKGWRVRC